MTSPNSKALKPPSDDVNPIRRLWWRFTWWFHDKVWSHMPRWLTYRVFSFKMTWYEQVSSRLFNRQRWLHKALGGTWLDKPSLIDKTLYECVIHFMDVNGEDAMNRTVWYGDEAHPEYAAIADKLKEIVKWAQTERPQMESAMYAAAPKHEIAFKPADKDGYLEMYWTGPDADKPYEEAYREWNRIDSEITRRDDEYLHWIVTNRAKLWT